MITAPSITSLLKVFKVDLTCNKIPIKHFIARVLVTVTSINNSAMSVEEICAQPQNGKISQMTLFNIADKD